MKTENKGFNKKLFYTLDQAVDQRYSVSVVKFPGGEVNVNINTGSLQWMDMQARNVKFVALNARIQSSDDLIAVLQAKDALHRMYANAVIDLFMPYIPYARQDRVCNGGESLSLRVFTDIINAAKFESVTVLDAHSPTAIALLDRCFAWDQFHCFGKIKQDWANWTIVAPDMGASKKCEDFARRVGAAGVIYFDKQRELSTGKIKRIQLLGEKPVDQKLLVLDDICDGGRTFVGMLPSLEGNRVDLAVTHGIFSAGVDVLTSAFGHVYTTDSWSVNLDILADSQTNNLTVLKL